MRERKYIESVLDRLGLKYKKSTRIPPGNPNRKEMITTVRLSSGQFKKFMVDNGYSLEGARNSSIPKVIWISSRETKRMFLRYLYGADGNYEFRNVDRVKRSIRYKTASKKLAEELAILLREFNISTSIRYNKASSCRSTEGWLVLVNVEDIVMIS